MMRNSQSGMALLEVLIAASMLAAVSYSVTNSVKYMTKASKNSVVKSELNEQLNMLMSYLGNSTLCPNVLASGLTTVLIGAMTSTNVTQAQQLQFSSTYVPGSGTGPVIFKKTVSFPSTTNDWTTVEIDIINGTPGGAASTYNVSTDAPGNKYYTVTGSVALLLLNNTGGTANSTMGASRVNINIPIVMRLRNAADASGYKIISCLASTNWANLNPTATSSGGGTTTNVNNTGWSSSGAATECNAAIATPAYCAAGYYMKSRSAGSIVCCRIPH